MSRSFTAWLIFPARTSFVISVEFRTSKFLPRAVKPSIPRATDWMAARIWVACLSALTDSWAPTVLPTASSTSARTASSTFRVIVVRSLSDDISTWKLARRMAASCSGVCWRPSVVAGDADIGLVDGLVDALADGGLRDVLVARVARYGALDVAILRCARRCCSTCRSAFISRSSESISQGVSW